VYHRITRKALLTIAAGLFSFFLILRLLLLFTPFKALKAFEALPYSTAFYDSKGSLLQVTSLGNGERREKLSQSQINKQIKKVFIKAEDKRFYFHHGVDFAALANAAIQNITGHKIIRGGSTISMQLVKMMSDNTSPTISRKLHDMYFANVLETKRSKGKIFELYINSLYFGHQATGLASAARTYYGCKAAALTNEQLCCLAVIPRNPTYYDPLKNPQNCAKRAAELYNRLYRKKISAQDFEQFLPKKLFSYPYEAPHYIRYLRQTEQSQETEITVSVNLELQKYAEQILNDALIQAEGSRISNASLLLIENKTGKPLAWVGSAKFFDEENSGQIDGVLVKNQPGSSMKPFLYALALETKDEEGLPLFTPGTILADIPMEFGGEKLYIPSNFNNRYNGPVRLRVALASSLNVPAVYILDKLGVDTYLSKLDMLGFESLKYTGEKADLGLALGAGEVTLKELVPAFSVFVRDGRDLTGTQIYETDTARLICSILSDKGARALGFGYTQTFETDYPAIFKTGTSNQYQNIIALGATKDYTIGVWMGNFDGQTVIGKTGSSLPAWAAKKLLDYMYGGKITDSKKLKQLEFEEPENWTRKKICSLSGMEAGPNCPATVYEYCFNGQQDCETCSWHKHIDGELQTMYPPEYQQWARTTKPDIQIDYNTSQLYIQTPKDNSLFYYSELHKEKQAVWVEVFGGAQNTLEIYYDDNYFGSVDRPFTFQLPVERGTHSCRVVCGEESCKIDFIVK